MSYTHDIVISGTTPFPFSHPTTPFLIFGSQQQQLLLRGMSRCTNRGWGLHRRCARAPTTTTTTTTTTTKTTTTTSTSTTTLLYSIGISLHCSADTRRFSRQMRSLLRKSSLFKEVEESIGPVHQLLLMIQQHELQQESQQNLDKS